MCPCKSVKFDRNCFMTCSLYFIRLALHLAVMQGRLNNVRALLTESNIDAEAYNLRSGLEQPKSHSTLADKIYNYKSTKYKQSCHLLILVCPIVYWSINNLNRIVLFYFSEVNHPCTSSASMGKRTRQPSLSCFWNACPSIPWINRTMRGTQVGGEQVINFMWIINEWTD